MKAIVYFRVSTDKQADKGISLDAQLEKMRQYCAFKDLSIVAEIADAGESAKSLDRPGIRQAVAMLRAGEADCLVIYKLDRLTRRLGDWTHLVENVFTDKGPALHSVTDSIDTRSASGRLVLNMLVTVAQWERETVSERTRAALGHLKAQGVKLGNPKGVKPSNEWQPTEEEKAVVLAVIAANPGASLRTIANALNAQGIKRQTVRDIQENGLKVTERPGKWHAQTVSRFLEKHQPVTA